MVGPLEGLVVVERAGRIATAATGYLLAQLGARVMRIEVGGNDAASPGLRRLCRGDKQIVAASGELKALWARLRREADVVILDPPSVDAPDRAAIEALLAAPADDTIVCAISPAGLHGDDLPPEAPEALVQALSGVMAVTGHRNGPPELVQVPVGELSAAVLACSAILGALRAKRAHKTGQLIDISLIEVLADQLRTHVAMVGGGVPKDFRIGCRHPVCCPWNSYRAQDGWLLICTSSDAQWRKFLALIGRSALNDDPRFATAATRREISDEVDAVVQGWVGTRSRDAVLSALAAIDVPVGAARTIPQVVADPLLARRGTLRREAGVPVIGQAVHVRDDAAAPSAPQPVSSVAGAAPLTGIRVVEITRFAAGPIAGLVLASLGAEVIKIESPGGEECRKWTPRFGAVSGYYANYNAGKRSVVLDLRQPDGRRGLEALVAGADVLLQNVRPGVMDEIGLGAAAATQRYARLVYASLNGYGLDGPKLAALDTVIQAEYGLTALIGDGEVPCRMGFSIADQLAGHITALGILAALARRDAIGRGGIVDTAMGDAIAWLTQLAWPDGAAAIGAGARLAASDGWIVAACDEATARSAGAGTRAELVARLAGKGILAAPVLEPHEVFDQPVIRARRSVYEIATEGGGMARVLVPPLGLTGTPVLRPSRLADLGADTAALLGASTKVA